jgi:hypothetical protein
MTAREIALALGGDGRPDTSGNYAAHCLCPAHKNGDRNASLPSRTVATAGCCSTVSPAGAFRKSPPLFARGASCRPSTPGGGRDHFRVGYEEVG